MSKNDIKYRELESVQWLRRALIVAPGVRQNVRSDDVTAALRYIDRLTAERDAAVVDAQRYRWLRREGAWTENYLSRKGAVSALFVSDGKVGHATDGEPLDAAIDAAMKEQEQGK